jgi:hypothetical protein
MRRVVAALLALVLMAQAPAPRVPEGIHQDVDGPPALCGFAGRDLADLERKVIASPGFVEENSNDRYRVFNRTTDFVQFVFPRAGVLGFPMATCRKVSANPDGTSRISREMRCDGTREECDAIFIQFRELDESITGRAPSPEART